MIHFLNFVCAYMCAYVNACICVQVHVVSQFMYTYTLTQDMRAERTTMREKGVWELGTRELGLGKKEKAFSLTFP